MSKKATKLSKSVSKKTSKNAAQVAPAAEPVVTTIPAADTTAAPVTTPAAAEKPAKAAKTKGVAVPRQERNGVKRPKAGGACARVWERLDANGDMTVADVRAWAQSEGLNPGNAATEIYLWRRFSGIVKPAKYSKEDAKQAA